MKTYIYIATIVLLIGLGYNLYEMDYKAGFMAEENFRSVLGIGACRSPYFITNRNN